VGQAKGARTDETRREKVTQRVVVAAPAARTPEGRTVLRIREVMRRTGLSRSSIYRRSADPGDDFPPCVVLGEQARGWFSDALDHWLAARPVAPRCAGKGESAASSPPKLVREPAATVAKGGRR